MNEIITPAIVEKRLKDLSKEIDDAHRDLIDLEADYHTTKATYEIEMARVRIDLSQRSAPNGKNYTVGEREDLAILHNAELHKRMGILEAQVKAARANTSRLKIQVDIARSVGTSVRTSMDLT